MFAGSYEALEDEEALEAALEAMATAEKALGAFSSALLAVEAASLESVSERIHDASSAAVTARHACRDLELESASLSGSEGGRIAAQHAALARRLQQADGTLDFLRATRQREALLAGSSSASASAAGGVLGVDPDKLSPSALIAVRARAPDSRAHA